MKINSKSRRMFLQGAGGTFLSIPFLASLAPRTAQAQTAAAPKRFVSILSTMDLGHNANWLPGGTGNLGNIPQPNRILQVGNGHHDIRWQPLRDYAPTATSSLAPFYGTSLSPYLEHINIFRSLDFCDLRGHDCSRALGGARSAVNPDLGSLAHLPTIDQFLNANRKFNPSGLPMIFAGTDGHTEYWSLAKSGTSVVRATPVDSLQAMYNTIFRSGAFPESGVSTQAHPRRDILSRVLQDFQRVMNSRYISSADRGTLSDAMDKFSDVHRGLAAASTGQCSHKNLNKSGYVALSAQSATVGKAIADMITAAIMCDAARTFTLGIDPLNNPYANVDFHDDISHRPFGTTSAKAHWQIMNELQSATIKNVMAPLVQALSAATDPSNGRSYLYNSLVFYSAEAGQVHGPCSLPAILAGNAGGALTSGNYVDYADRAKGSGGYQENFSGTAGNAQFSNNWRGVHYNRLLVTILQGMGLSPADYENNALNSQVYNRTDLGTLNRNLTNIGGWGYAIAADLTRRGEYGVDLALEQVPNYDLKFFGAKLPLPA